MMNHWLFKCNDITDMVSRSMDERLPFWTRAGIKMHLMVCFLCTRYKKQLDLIHDALGKISNDNLIPEKKLPDEVKIRLKRLLE